MSHQDQKSSNKTLVTYKWKLPSFYQEGLSLREVEPSRLAGHNNADGMTRVFHSYHHTPIHDDHKMHSSRNFDIQDTTKNADVSNHTLTYSSNPRSDRQILWSSKDDHHDFISAAANGDVNKLNLLSKQGVDIYVTDSNGWNALFHSVYHNQIDATRHLLNQFCFDPNVKDIYGITPIIIASKNGNIDMIDLLVHRGADIYAVDVAGWNVLICGSFYEHSEVIDYFLQRGMSPDFSNSCNVTALMIASERGNFEMVRSLINKGARVDLVDHLGRGVLHYGSFSFDNPFLRSHKKAKVVHYFITEHHLDINSRDHDGNTPLIYAIMTHQRPIVETLIRLGADPYITNRQGLNAFDIAKSVNFDLNWYIQNQR